MSDSKIYSNKDSTRNNRGDTPNKYNNSTAIDNEVRELIKKTGSEYEALTELNTKYGEDKMIKTVFTAYKDKMDYIRRKADKFKNVLVSKYGNMNMPFSEIMRKAKKYSIKYKFTNDEFDAFFKLACSDNTLNTTNIYNVPATKMGNTLGYSSAMAVGDKLKVKENEYSVLDKILKIHTATKPLHQQIILQSLTYRDCATEALYGKFDSMRHNPYSYIHPVIAALFLPKVNYLDEHMLIASIANIVKSKREGLPIVTKPEFELFWDIVTDPNELECVDMRASPIEDLLNRIYVQNILWESVLSLRRGVYYNEKLASFLMAIDNCSGSVFDTPDLVYVKDEGTILRRLLGAFSLRPTVVTTTPLYNGAVSNFSPVNLSQVTTVPVITLRIPLNISNKNVSVKLREGIEQAQWYLENKKIIPKSQSIIHSRDVVFFYVPRRYQNINFARLTAPFNFANLPVTVSGFEKINDVVVDFDYNLTIMNDSFNLRSVVIIERSKTNSNLIVGCSTLIVVDGTPYGDADGYIIYDPQGAAIAYNNPQNQPSRSSPISKIRNTPSYSNDVNNEYPSFYDLASKCGTIFMYVKQEQTGIFN
jgi:hypothetical protein